MSDIIPVDTKIWGPGVWMTLHILSYTSDTLIKVKLFITTLLNVVNNLPCKKCRKHAIEFMKKNKYESYINLKRSNKFIGPFKYVCDMHNNANVIIGNPKINWLVSYEKYSHINELCDGPCDDEIYNSNNYKIFENVSKHIQNNSPNSTAIGSNSVKDKILKFVQPKHTDTEFDIDVEFIKDVKKIKYNFK